jgi:TonB-linked SusC/RagA family outer membrane protein
MEKNSVLRVFSNLTLRKIITVINISLLIIMVSTLNVLAGSDEPKTTANTSENELQQASISGKVIDATTGEAVVGANVMIEGTTRGAITDINGAFSIPSTGGEAKLVISFIGYVTQVIPTQGKTVINVSLVSETTGLDEVVVVGYGSQKKQTLTGSVASLKSEQILSTKSISMAASIQGKIPGVQIRQQTGEPGTFNSRISVRGFGTPLLVIDGVVRDQMDDFERLNPEDIESVSVLKDAAASIYGLGAANGVFIVTTKKGFAGKTEFSLNTMYSTKTPTNDWSNINVDAYTMRYMWNEMSRNSQNLTNLTTDADLEKWKANTEPGFTDFNWWDALVRKHVTSQEVTLNARGGTDVITFFSSFGYNNDGGYFKNNELNQYDRYTFRTNVEAKLAKGLRMNVSFYGRYEKTINPNVGTTWTFKRTITNDRGIGPYTLDGLGHYTQVPSENTNVFAEESRDASGYVEHYRFQYQTTIDINYDLPFLKGASIGLLTAYDGQNNDDRTLSKNFILYDYITGLPKTTSVAPTRFRQDFGSFLRKELQAKVAYAKRFGDHNINATLVYQMRRIDNNSAWARRQYDDVFTTAIINQGSLTNSTNGGTRSEEAYLSYLGRFNYDYKSKYLLELSVRRDGTYRYSPDQRWGTFPAVSAGWRLGQEEFFKNALPFVSDFKLRASWGKSGRDAGNPFDYYEGYTFGGVSGGYIFTPGTLTLGMVPPGIVNSNRTWVNTTTVDLGLDLELWKGKLGFVFDVFKRNENGLLASRATALPNTFGASYPQENLNSQFEQGFDFSLSHRNTIGQFNYGITGSFTYTRTYLTHVERAPNQNTWDVWKNGNDTYDDKGRIQGRVFMQERDGIYTNINQTETAPLNGGSNGNYYVLPGMDIIKDTDGNGVLNGDDALPITWSGAGTNPPLQFGANLNASYKGFDMVVGLAGSSLFTMAKSRGDQWGYGVQYRFFLAEFLDRWHTANITDNPFDPATVWIPGKWEALTINTNGTQTGTTTDKWRMDATYLRLKSVEIGYNIPAKYARAIGLKSARVYLNGYNIFTICNPFLKDMDPERDEGAFSAGNTYPLMRSYNIGLNIKF